MTPDSLSKELSARVPTAGSRWVWELDKPHARAIVEVVEAFWNGEKWWVRTKSLSSSTLWPGDYRYRTSEHLNELDRFMEACTPIGGSMKGMLESRAPVVSGADA